MNFTDPLKKAPLNEDAWRIDEKYAKDYWAFVATELARGLRTI